MRIKVTNISNNSNEIIFETVVGIGKGFWMDQSPPNVGNFYDVEFEICDSLTLGKNVCFAKDNKEIIQIDGDYLCVQGKIEQVESDELVVLRVGESIFMLDNFTQLPPVGTFIQIRITLPQVFNNNT